MSIFEKRPERVEAFYWTDEADQVEEPGWFLQLKTMDAVRIGTRNGRRFITSAWGDGEPVYGPIWVVRLGGRVALIPDKQFRATYAPVGSTWDSFVASCTEGEPTDA